MSFRKNVVAIDQLMKNIMQANLLNVFVYLFFYIALFVLFSTDATVLELFPIRMRSLFSSSSLSG